MSAHASSFMLHFILMMCCRPVASLRCCWFTSVEDPLGLLQQLLFVDYSRFV